MEGPSLKLVERSIDKILAPATDISIGPASQNYLINNAQPLAWSWHDFMGKIDRIYPKYGQTLPLPFETADYTDNEGKEH